MEPKTTKTYNTGDSPVVTDLSTDPAVGSLSKGERTGSRVLYRLWSYVLVESVIEGYRVASGSRDELRGAFRVMGGFCECLCFSSLLGHLELRNKADGLVSLLQNRNLDIVKYQGYMSTH